MKNFKATYKIIKINYKINKKFIGTKYAFETLIKDFEQEQNFIRKTAIRKVLKEFSKNC